VVVSRASSPPSAEVTGATAIYVNGMSMMPAAMSAEELTGRIGAPVLDPLRISLRTAEVITEFGARRHRTG
jgi:hypothetical protein